MTTQNPFLDTRGDVRVQSLSGLDAEWDTFRLKFEAYTDLLGMGEFMDAAEQEAGMIDNATLKVVGAVDCSKALYALLIAKCEGKALGVITLVPRRHGLEAWRLLKAEYEGKQGSRIAAMLRGILNPGMKSSWLGNATYRGTESPAARISRRTCW